MRPVASRFSSALGTRGFNRVFSRASAPGASAVLSASSRHQRSEHAGASGSSARWPLLAGAVVASAALLDRCECRSSNTSNSSGSAIPGDPLIRHPSEIDGKAAGSRHALMHRYFVADAAEQVLPAVTHINLNVRIPGAGWVPAVAVQGGSGFIISEDGLIVTNAHVVSNAGPDDPIMVTLYDGRKLSATVHSWDTRTDIAVLQADCKGLKLPVAKIGQSSKLRVGEWVVALGSPKGLANTVTVGIVSALARMGSELGVLNSRSEFLQTDASINMGNSGGPLVNLDGEVVGINTLKLGGADGIGFAIPIDIAWQVVQQLLRYKRVRRPYVGLAFRVVALDMQDAINGHHERSLGMYILEIKPGSPAEKGGLKEGDVIIEADGKPVSNLGDLADRIGVEPGKTITFKVLRPGKREALTLKVTSVPDERIIAP